MQDGRWAKFHLSSTAPTHLPLSKKLISFNEENGKQAKLVLIFDFSFLQLPLLWLYKFKFELGKTRSTLYFQLSRELGLKFSNFYLNQRRFKLSYQKSISMRREMVKLIRNLYKKMEGWRLMKVKTDRGWESDQSGIWIWKKRRSGALNFSILSILSAFSAELSFLENVCFGRRAKWESMT